MRIEVVWHVDMWQEIKDNAMFTVHKSHGKYPDEQWKKDLILSEHSPIRSGRLIINCYDVEHSVVMHMVRHKIGFEPFVASFRPERFKSEVEQGRKTPQDLRFDGDFQSFINITRRRECTSASLNTRKFWQEVLNEVGKYEPELKSRCVRECIYRGGCPEYPESCGWWEKFVAKNKAEDLLDIKKRYDIYNELRDRNGET